MGYKLAGYSVIGCVEIDPEMMSLYRENLHPVHPYLMDIKAFNKIPLADLPHDLFDLDILDGSPPCSTFSVAGKRSEKWGKEMHFREGQAAQRLDMLFFDFIETAARLKPKVVIAENVSGLMIGQSRGYVSEILQGFKDIGYTTQVFKLNAATMGVPQARERVFFISSRSELKYPKLKLGFHEAPIPYGKIKSIAPGPPLRSGHLKLWNARQYGDTNMGHTCERVNGKVSYFNTAYLYDERIVTTVTSTEFGRPVRFSSPHYISDEEIILAQTFPQDYKFGNSKVQYVCGMSVPPVMMSRIAQQVYDQWLKQSTN